MGYDWSIDMGGKQPQGEEDMFVYGADSKETACDPGVTRKVLAWSDALMMCEFTFLEGAQGKAHAHPHLQVTYVAAGSFSFTIGEETRTVNSGDSMYIPANSVHSVAALSSGKLVDVFSPKRDEFLK
jgi:quercetin dioxygenase-like cupin family protein